MTSVKEELLTFLKKNVDLFAWTIIDMPRIDPEFMCHYLAVFSKAQPIAQKIWKISPDRTLIIQEEVQNLLDTGFIHEVMYSTWFSNVIMVKKSNGKQRMCLDYTNLNKVYLKDSYPLLSIDGLVDAVSGLQFLLFMDT